MNGNRTTSLHLQVFAFDVLGVLNDDGNKTPNDLTAYFGSC
jgi:hypothetical protein